MFSVICEALRDERSRRTSESREGNMAAKWRSNLIPAWTRGQVAFTKSPLLSNTTSVFLNPFLLCLRTRDITEDEASDLHAGKNLLLYLIFTKRFDLVSRAAFEALNALDMFPTDGAWLFCSSSSSLFSPPPLDAVFSSSQ